MSFPRAPIGHANANLTGAFGHADQHDIHNTDAAHNQGDHRDGREQQGHGFGLSGSHFGDLLLVAHGEVIILARSDFVGLAQQFDNLLLNRTEQALGLAAWTIIEPSVVTFWTRNASSRWCRG